MPGIVLADGFAGRSMRIVRIAKGTGRQALPIQTGPSRQGPMPIRRIGHGNGQPTTRRGGEVPNKVRKRGRGARVQEQGQAKAKGRGKRRMWCHRFPRALPHLGHRRKPLLHFRRHSHSRPLLRRLQRHRAQMPTTSSLCWL